MSPVVNHRSLPARAGLLSCLALLASAATASDEEDLHRLLDEFLANADRVEMHEAFWADELVYTSSDGARTDKQAIVASMKGESTEGGPAGPVYSAADVDIRVYGDVAVVAFRLVARGPAAGEPSEYFNTGTFLRQKGVWRAVAWQATRIPPATQDSGD